ncbi:hypothetical protein [Desulfonatronum thioautotrophicum]|uniref:hypothetical protein n=1 Tax=Desulfonatronum thioautotrophicum TaxID=617001 RepID=UPI0012948158|nr:hypothetical protein [Desulfonatronum thioautotrophicum]
MLIELQLINAVQWKILKVFWDGSESVDTSRIEPPASLKARRSPRRGFGFRWKDAEVKNSPPIGDADSSRQGGAMFLESSFFSAFRNLFLGVPRVLSEQRERAVRYFNRGNNFVLPKKCQPVYPTK